MHLVEPFEGVLAVMGPLRLTGSVSGQGGGGGAAGKTMAAGAGGAGGLDRALVVAVEADLHMRLVLVEQAVMATSSLSNGKKG